MEHSAKIRQLLEEKKKIFTDLNDEVWAYAEPRFAEYKSAAAHCRVLEAEGVCPGYITHECRGEAGFGYDPIFAVGEKTFAEMTAKEKDDVSHRGIALRKFKEVLQQALEEK